MNVQNIKIENIKLNLSNSHTLASFTIIFIKDNLKITGFRIIEKENKRWLLPPFWKDNKDDWHKIVIITEREEWKELEKRIIAEYDKNQTKTTLSDNSEIKPEEVPF